MIKTIFTFLFAFIASGFSTTVTSTPPTPPATPTNAIEPVSGTTASLTYTLPGPNGTTVNVPPAVIIAFATGLIKNGATKSGIDNATYNQILSDVKYLETAQLRGPIHAADDLILDRLFSNCMKATHEDVNQLINQIPIANPLAKQALTTTLTVVANTLANQIISQPLPKTKTQCLSCLGNDAVMIATTVGTQLLQQYAAQNAPAQASSN